MNNEEMNTEEPFYCGFIIPKGYSLERSFEGEWLKSSIVHDNNGKVFAKLYYEKDKLNGICEFYKDGVLTEKRTYKDGVADGWGCLFTDNEEGLWFKYVKGIRISMIESEDSDGFRKEKNVKTGELISAFRYNSNHKPIGNGFLFEKNVVKKEVNNKNDRVLREYEDSQMKEYDKNGKIVYEGGFANDYTTKYPREGFGKSYKQGRVLYEGEWKRNKPHGKGKLYDSDGEVLHEGVWKKGKLKRKNWVIEYDYEEIKMIMREKGLKRLSLKNPKNRKKVLICTLCILICLILIGGLGYALYYNYLLNSVQLVYTKQEFDELNRKVRFIEIPSNSCNEDEFTEFDLSAFSNLETIDIGDDCLKNVYNVRLNGLTKLERMSIGKNSFYNNKTESVEKVFELKNCNLLSELNMKRLAFRDFSKLDMESLLSLRSVKIGEIGYESRNFMNAPLQLRGFPKLDSLVIGDNSFSQLIESKVKDVPKLENVYTGEKGESIGFSKITEAFVKYERPITMHNNITKITIPSNSYNSDFNILNLKGFPALKKLEVGKNCFGNVSNLNVEEVSNLVSINIGESSFYNASSVVIQNLPVLETIEIEENGLYCNGENATLVMSDLPALNNVTSENNSFRGVTSLTLTNAPNITVINLPSAFVNLENSTVSNSGVLEEFVSNITTAHNLQELEQMGTTTRMLVIPADSCNEGNFTSLSLHNYPLLESIEIGENSCKNVVHFNLSHLTSLKLLIVGDESFSMSMSASVNTLSTSEKSFYLESECM